jgi:[ribosomal protein S5]-alanine N-acetyltransferase
MEFEYLETERLRLRKISSGLLKQLFTELNDADLMAFLGLTTIDELEIEKAKMQQGLTTFKQDFLNFQLIEKQTGICIGWCGFHSWFPVHRRAEIGYHLLDEKYMGKGYMREAIQVVVAYGFNHMDLNRIEACIGPNNTASLLLVKKLGFVQEGHLKQHYFKNNILEDSLIFALLAEDYKP